MEPESPPTAHRMEVSLLRCTLEVSTRRAATAVMVYRGSYRGLFGREINQAAANEQEEPTFTQGQGTLTPSGHAVIYIHLIDQWLEFPGSKPKLGSTCHI